MLYFLRHMAVTGSLAERWNSLTLEQRLSVGVLGVAGLAAFVFGLIQVRHGLIRPFTTDVQELVELRKAFGPTDEELVAQQQRTDTDGDGISDFDELNRYHSSPYVRDSDSDGEPDNIEVAKGTDPNCARGKTCTGTSTGLEASSSTGGTFGNLPLPDYSAYPGGGQGSMPSAVPPRDVAAIRAYLRASGVNDAEYSDAQLLEAYDQSSVETGASASSTTP